MKKYKTRVRYVEAKQITTDGVVEAYNGPRIAFAGDYVMKDYLGRTVVIRKKKFERMYEKHEADDGTVY